MPSSAETSSWSQRAPERSPSLQGGPANPAVAPKRRATVKQQSRRRDGKARSPLRGPLPGLETKLGPSSAQPSGKDAAYIALEMGLYAQAKRLAEADAKAGRAEAHTLLGLLYGRGLGVAADAAASARWYAKAAELGDTEGAFAYGLALIEGRGVKKDAAKAAGFFEAAALKGHTYAHYNLALMFLAGAGRPENARRAAAHLTFAAERGIARAQYDLATLYAKGHGVKADAYLASYWLRQAASSGLVEAEYEYAVALLQGRGLNEDRPDIPRLLRSAASKGVPGAQNRLAHLIFEGRIVRTDPVEAAKWRLLAKAGGIADAALDKQLAALPKAQRTAAADAADRFREASAVGTALTQ